MTGRKTRTPGRTRPGGAATLRPGPGADQDRLHGRAVRPAGRAGPGPVRRLHDGGRAQRRQARRRAGAGAARGQPAQARRGHADRAEADREGERADHHRHHLLQRDDGGAQADHREGRVPDRQQRRPGADRRRAVLALPVHRLLAERQPGRGGGQVRHRQGLQARHRHGAQLPGGQGLRRRLQAHVQGRGHRRDLHAAEPARLLRRAGPGGGQEPGRGLRVLPRRPGRELRAPVPAGRPAGQDPAAVVAAPPTARRCRRRRKPRWA